MLHILLMILKIIGIVLLIIVALIVLLGASLLFVPARYKAWGKFDRDMEGEVRVTWLLHVVSLRITGGKKNGREPVLHMVLKIFGRRFYDNLAPPEPKKKKRQLFKKKTDAAKKNEKITGEENENSPKAHTNRQAEDTESGIENSKRKIPEPITGEDEQAAQNTVQKDLQEDRAELAGPEAEIPKSTDEAKSIFKRLKSIPQKIRQFFSDLKRKFANLRSSFRKGLEKVQKLFERRDYILSILTDTNNKTSFDKMKRTALVLYRHSIPLKLRGNLWIGFEDPETTGYALAALSVLYPVMQDNLKVYPDFENPVLKGDIWFKGRLRAFVFMKAAFSIILDKDIKRIYGSFKS